MRRATLSLFLAMCVLAMLRNAALAQEASPAPAPTAATPDQPREGPTDSPRAVMFTFLQAANMLEQSPDGTDPDAGRMVAQCFARPAVGPEVVRQLKGVIDKLGTVQESDLPDADALLHQDVRRFVFFPRASQHQWVYDELKPFGLWPRGEVAFQRLAGGKWVFSDETLANLPALAESMAPLPPRHAVSTPGLSDSTGHLVGILGVTFERTQWWQWAALLGAIFAGVVLGRVAQTILRGIASRLEKGQFTVRAAVFSHAASPASLALLTLGISAGVGMIHLQPTLREFFGQAVQFLYLLAAGWFLYNLVDLIQVALTQLTSKTNSKLDDMIVPLIRKTLRIFLVIVFTIVALQNVFQLNITGFLASLGIAGLAISLAAQDSVKNLFGSLTVFFDKPFAIGDRIVFDGSDGIVEEIGFRSTRIRTLVGHLVTVPNMKFIDSIVENVSARPSIRRIMDVTITYDTPPAKVERAIAIIRHILCEDADIVAAFNMEKTPPRIAFDNFNADSLNIKAIYWYTLADGRDYWGYLAHAQQVNLKILQAYGAEDIEFAFPTQTLYLASDPARPLRARMEAPPKPAASSNPGEGRAYT